MTVAETQHLKKLAKENTRIKRLLAERDLGVMASAMSGGSSNA